MWRSMTTSGFITGGPKAPRETAEERAARLARERKVLESAREDIRAGRCISGPELDAFLDWFVADDDTPPPPAPSK